MMAKRFGGRKWLSCILLVLLCGLNSAFDLGIEKDVLQQIAMIFGAWVLGESVIDAASAHAGNGRKEGD